MRTILVSGYFEGGSRDAKAAYFERLGAALRPNGLRLHLLNLNSAALHTRCSWEALPWAIEKSHWLPLHRWIEVPTQDPDVAHAASIDALCWNRSHKAESLRVLLFREHLRRIIEREKPVLHIAWHQFFSFHFSLPGMLRDLGVPLLFVEYGPLPGTIIFDREGQMAESPVTRRSREYLDLPLLDTDVQCAQAYLQMVRSERRTRKPQAMPGLVAKALAAHKVGERKVIFYAGQYDCRTGMLPRTLPNALLHSPWFAGTFEGLKYLSKLAIKNDWLILFKPHPLQAMSVEDAETLRKLENVVAVSHASIFECFEHANATVTLVSQVSYMSLIHGKSCVLLGRNYLSGMGCVYEPESIERIEDHIVEALRDGLTPQRQRAWEEHVARLLKYTVFGFDPDLAVAGLRGIEDAAAFVGANRQAEQQVARNSESAAGRAFLSAYEFLRRVVPARRSAIS